jgi:hypothetical protein
VPDDQYLYPYAKQSTDHYASHAIYVITEGVDFADTAEEVGPAHQCCPLFGWQHECLLYPQRARPKTKCVAMFARAYLMQTVFTLNPQP